MSEITIKVNGSIEIKTIAQKLSSVKKARQDKNKEINQFKYERNMRIGKAGGFLSEKGRAIMTETYPPFKKMTHESLILDGKVEALKELLKDFMEDVSENILDYIY